MQHTQECFLHNDYIQFIFGDREMQGFRAVVMLTTQESTQVRRRCSQHPPGTVLHFPHCIATGSVAEQLYL